MGDFVILDPVQGPRDDGIVEVRHAGSAPLHTPCETAERGRAGLCAGEKSNKARRKGGVG